MPEEHNCVADFTPYVDSYDEEEGEPTLSATLGAGEVEVYGYCVTCGDDITITYEYREAEVNDL